MNKPLVSLRPEDQKSIAKMVMVALVVAAGVAKPNFIPGSFWYVGCEVVVSVGAAFGIVSSGLSKGR